MTIWTEVSSDVLEMALTIIDQHHPDLAEARIGFVFRDKAQSAGAGRVILGQASKVPEKLRVFMDYDFLIWLSLDDWGTLGFKERQALLDHELCHCMLVDGEPKIRPHDIEEFQCIIDRYGFWSPQLKAMAPAAEKALEARQLGLPMEAVQLRRLGAVLAVKPEQMETLEDESNGNGHDALLEKAIALAREEGKVSVSMLQRHLRVGYAQAGRLLEALEERGLISEPGE